jgi:hypothetical protein
MKVTEISVQVRYSKPLEDGSHKTLQVGVEASLDPEEDWAIAQQGLYSMVTQQLRTLWAKNGTSPDYGQLEEASWEQIKAMPSPREHYCPIHEKPFKRFEKLKGVGR